MNHFGRGPAVAGRFQRAGRTLSLISLWFVLAAAIWG